MPLRTRLRPLRAPLAAFALITAAAGLSFAVEVCEEVFTVNGTKSVCVDCSRVSLSQRQEALCNAKCADPRYRGRTGCYRRGEHECRPDETRDGDRCVPNAPAEK
jgi:hypothetical protein